MIYKEYVITPAQFGERFHLQRTIERQRIGTGTPQKPNGDKYEDLEDLGYDFQLDWLLEKIVLLETAKSKDTKDIDTLVKAFAKEKKELMDFWLKNKVQQDPNFVSISLEEYNMLKTFYELHNSEE